MKTWKSKRKVHNENKVVRVTDKQFWVYSPSNEIYIVFYHPFSKKYSCECDWYENTGGKRCTHVESVELTLKGNSTK